MHLVAEDGGSLDGCKSVRATDLRLLKRAPLNLDEDDERVLCLIQANTIEGSTEKGLNPERAYGLWKAYLEEHGCNEALDWCLGGHDYGTWLRRLQLFYTWLYRGKEDPRRIHRSLRLFLRRKGFNPPQFGDEAVKRFFKGLERFKGENPKSRHQAVRRFVNRRLPVPTGFHRRMRELFWKKDARERHGQRGVHEAFAYIVGTLQYVTLRRISNFAHTVADRATTRRKTISVDADDKHALRVKDVLIAVNSGLLQGLHPCDVRGRETRLLYSNEWRPGEMRRRSVVGICFMFWSSKKGEIYLEPFWLKRGRSEDEEILIDDVLHSRRWASNGPDDLFFAAQALQSWRTRGARLLGSDVNEVIKATARSYGLPDTNFSTTSLRKLAMSNLGALGVPDPGILRLSRHVNIRTVRRHYMFPINRVPRSHKPVASLLEVDSESGFNTDDLHELIGVMAMARFANGFEVPKKRKRVAKEGEKKKKKIKRHKSKR